MNRMKFFLKWALIIVAFYIFSNVMINVALKCNYNPIDYHVLFGNNGPINVDIVESKATYVNGVVSGKIINQSQENVFNKYLKIEVFSERNVSLGCKYVNIGYLHPNGEQEFRMGFRFTDAAYCKLDVVDEVPEGTLEFQFWSEELKGARLIAAVILMCYL